MRLVTGDDLSGTALDYAVSKALGHKPVHSRTPREPSGRPRCHEKKLWVAGRTPLIAAMRCFVRARLGDEIEIPFEIPEAA